MDDKLNKNNVLIDMLLQDYNNINSQIDFTELNNKKIFITGASGLVGVNLLASLLYLKLQCGYNFHVIGIVNSEPEDWFKELINMGNFGYIRGDLSNTDFVNRLNNYDYIIHAATYGQPIKFMNNQIKTIKLNTSTTMELLNKLKDNGKFLFLSSSEIYSGLNKDFYNENDIGTTTPNHSRSCYIESKRCGEAICNVYDDNVKIVRLCLAYGMGIKLNDTRAMNNFILSGLNNNCIRLMDSGSAKRNYIYIVDAIMMMWNILLHGKDKVYNVGGKSEISIFELSQMIGSKLNIDVIRSDVDVGLSGSPDSVNLDMGRYENEFGKMGLVDLSDGVPNVIHWCELLQNNKNATK
jgi:dTDP-glucose 4,6-dehydratase/UDP-glucuronate decarboxylase